MKRIIIENFKSMKRLEMDVPRFGVIVGNNGVGKTNFLKAVKLISLLASGEQVRKALSKLNLLPRELLFDKHRNTIRFEAHIELEGKGVVYSFEIRRDVIEKIATYGIREETLTNGSSTKPILKRQGDRVEIDAEDSDARFAAASVTESQLALSVITSPGVIVNTKQFLSSMLVEQYNPDSLREMGSISATESGFEKNLTEILYGLKEHYSDRFEAIISEMKQIIPGLDTINVSPLTSEKLIISFKESELADAYTFFSSSDGNLRTLAILTALLKKPRPSVIFIDEIENSLHPKRIKPLMKFLDYCAEKENNSVQIVITTHSPVVVEYADPREIVFMFKRGAETHVAVPENNPRMLEHIYVGSIST